MRTKSLLLAAAALAAGVITSQAQSAVYSANIVGYVNQTFSAGKYSMVVAALQATNGNASAEQVLTAVHANDNILLWNGSGYDNYVYTGSPGLWIGPSGPGSAPTLNAGQAFFYFNSQGTDETNTCVGTVVLTNSTTLPTGYTLVGSTAPLAAGIDSTNYSLPFQANDNVLLWNGNGFDNYVYTGSPGLWIGPSGPGAAPAINVGQGFFYFNSSSSPETWIENVVVQ